MNIHKIAQVVGVKKPFDIILQSNSHKKYSATCLPIYKNGKLVRHSIVVNMGNLKNGKDRNLKTLIAHEFIHAWQAENRRVLKHGKVFARKSAEVNMALKLPRIFLPDVDTD